jgi:Pyruvate/2-oxoacid:ferredoxin oxidoreductase gamma subunit
MAYNRRGGPASVGPAWIDATNRIGNAAWIKNQDDGLRSFPLSATEIGDIVVKAKAVARVNAILMGALARTYGACFPAKLLQ